MYLMWIEMVLLWLGGCAIGFIIGHHSAKENAEDRKKRDNSLIIDQHKEIMRLEGELRYARFNLRANYGDEKWKTNEN